MSTGGRVTVVDAVVEAKSGGSAAIWTYRAAGQIRAGDALLVPLGPRAVIAYALRVYDADESDLGFPVEQLKPVIDRIQGLDLPRQLLEVVQFLSAETLSPLPVTLGVAAAPGARERILTTWTAIDGEPLHPLSAAQSEVLAALRATGSLSQTTKKKLPAATLRILKILEEKECVVRRREALPAVASRSEVGLLRLCPDGAKLEQFLKKEGNRRPAQALVVMRLQGAERAALSREEIRALCGVTDQTIRALLASGLLETTEAVQQTPKIPPEPNPHQQVAIDAIVGAIEARESQSFLLYGVTGSGKTEVFLRSANEALRMGRQVLYLVPEIALATQAIAQLRERFGERVTILHSELPPGRRLDHWLRVRSGAAPVVLGARSALFAPLSNVGLIVMDEEHEGSYKQDTSPRYHAKAVAMKLAELHQCPVVLGSATPSIETFFEAQSGVHTLLTLPSRAASAKLPTVIVDDLTEGYRRGQPAILAPCLHTRMHETLARGEQVILFLNRRAYSPFLICRDCGLQFKCPRCSVSLSFSRHQRKLRCHHCDYQETPPDVCPKCGGARLSPLGIGTEKVEEAVSLEFPDVTVARLDRDVSRRKGALEEILARFRSGDVQVLVGTQIVAKGLDFPNVTLVGVITADTSLSVPDFRSSERTFQLLSQVAGRAGRGTSPGFVVVQTFNPEHIAIESARDHDYERLFGELILERRAAGYPPFKRLVNVLISGEDISHVRALSLQVAQASALVDGTEVLGPVDAAIERLAGRWRRHVLIKLDPKADLVPLGQALAPIKAKDCVVAVDVDPYSLL